MILNEPTPTMAQPGSEEKISIMTARVRDGEKLWSDDDVTVLPDRLEQCWSSRGPIINWRQVLAKEAIQPLR